MSSDTPAVVNSDSAADEVKDDSVFQSDESPEAKEAVAPRKKKGRGKWFLLVFVLVLVVGAAGGGWYFAQEQWSVTQTERELAVDNQVADLEAELSALRDQLSAQGERQKNMESALVASSTETESQLLSLAERVSATESTGSGDWVLAEAEYLLRIANQRLVTSQDIDGAIEMMAAADNIFKDLAYPELTEARRQLVADITRLKLVKPIDYEGIYFALDALLPSVVRLSGTKVEQLEKTDIEASAESGWRSYWSAVVEAVSPYIVINSSSQNEPHYLLSDEQESLIKSEIQLQIRQAQLAMMSGKADLYETALYASAEQIEEVFVNDEQSESLASALREFAQRSISTEAVDISGSIRAVEGVVDQMARVRVLDQTSAEQ